MLSRDLCCLVCTDAMIHDPQGRLGQMRSSPGAAYCPGTTARKASQHSRLRVLGPQGLPGAIAAGWVWTWIYRAC